MFEIMNLKKYLPFWIILILINAGMVLFTNYKLLSLQKDYADLQTRYYELDRETAVLEREAAKLGSLKRISERAEEMGLVNVGGQIVKVDMPIFAMR